MSDALLQVFKGMSLEQQIRYLQFRQASQPDLEDRARWLQGKLASWLAFAQEQVGTSGQIPEFYEYWKKMLVLIESAQAACADILEFTRQQEYERGADSRQASSDDWAIGFATAAGQLPCSSPKQTHCRRYHLQ